jgi:hypothetical protein
MPAENTNLVREVLACLMCSRMYFDLGLAERLNLVRTLTAELARDARPATGE